MIKLWWLKFHNSSNEILQNYEKFCASFKWDQIEKYLDIDDKIYHKSYQQKYITEKMFLSD